MLLCHGNWEQSLLFNPFTIVYVALFASSAAVLATQKLRGQRLVLSPRLAKLWLAALLLGWLAKLALGSRYW